MGVPKPGGNYTHFKYLAEELRDFEWTLLQIGNSNLEGFQDERFVNIGKDLDRKKDARKLAEMLIKYLVQNEFDILIPMNSPIAVSIIPFLPQDIKVVNIVNSNTPRVYKYVTEHIDFISSIIAISPQQKKELERRSVKKEVHLIPHGQTIPSKKSKKEDVFSIGYIGRIHDAHKGVLRIPEILKELSFKFKFDIVGDGVDSELLLSKLDEAEIPYNFHGFKDGEEKEEIISQWDIFLFPSIVEGFGLTLIECMKYGVIPLANKIEDITDYIIDEEVNGYIITNNHVETYRERLQYLFDNKEEREQMSRNAIKKVSEKFNLMYTIPLYKNVFLEAMEYSKPTRFEMKKWKPYQEYRPSIMNKILRRLYGLKSSNN